jgi:hypothetical protein
MGVSKPQEYCQELQLAVGRAKLPGYFGACALSNRNEQLNLQKRTYFVGTEAPLSQESGQRYQNSYTPRLGPILMVLRLAGLAGYGNRSVLDRYRPSMDTNLRRSKGTGCRCRARRGAKIERPNRGSLSGNQITCGRNSVKIRS